MDSALTLPIPPLSSFSGDLNSVISSIARNIQIITSSINVIREDQHTLFTRDLPALQRQQSLILSNQSEILSHLSSISSKTSDDLIHSDKINSFCLRSSEPSVGYIPSISTYSLTSSPIINPSLRSEPTRITPQGVGVVGSSLPVSKSLSVRYCDNLIPDSDLDRLSPDDLSRLKQNISSSKWKYKQDNKLDLVHMCQLNMDRINSRLSVASDTTISVVSP